MEQTQLKNFKLLCGETQRSDWSREFHKVRIISQAVYNHLVHELPLVLHSPTILSDLRDLETH